MSYELRIRVYGSIINLVIGEILKEQQEALFHYCKSNGKKLKRVWYFASEEDQEFMKKLFQIAGPWSWVNIAPVYNIDGPLFADQKQTQDFLRGTLASPKIQEVYLNGIKKYDSSKIRCYYKNGIELPDKRDDYLFVYYGFIDRLGLTYIFKTESENFEEKNLGVHFTDCGEHGIILSKMFYEGSAPKKRSRGSTRVYFLDVKFS